MSMLDCYGICIKIKKVTNMIKHKDKITYGMGNFSNGIILQALTSYLVFYGTTILGISGTVIGLMVSLSVVWDAVSDPFVGHLSDYTTNRKFGRRHLYMIVGTAGLVIFNIVLWSINPSSSMGLKVTLMFAMVILVKTFMTIYVTPYNALGGELSEDYHERTTIQAYRTVFFTLGLAFTTVAGMVFYFRPTEAYPVGQLNPASYMNLGITISVLILICSTVAIVATFKYIPTLPKNTRGSQKRILSHMAEELKIAFKNRNYLNVAGAYLSANIATAILGAIGLHVFTYTFDMNNYEIGMIFGLLFALSVLSQVFWIDITKKVDKKVAAKLAATLSGVGAIIFIGFVLNRQMVINHFQWLALYAIPSGIGVGGLITLPFSMIADTVDQEEYETGNRSEGLYYGGLTFSYKISQSIAIFLVGIVLDLVRFDSDLPVQSNMTVIALGLLVGLGSLVALIAAWGFYTRYNLSKNEIDRIKEEIDLKRTLDQKA